MWIPGNKQWNSGVFPHIHSLSLLISHTNILSTQQKNIIICSSSDQLKTHNHILSASLLSEDSPQHPYSAEDTITALDHSLNCSTYTKWNTVIFYSISFCSTLLLKVCGQLLITPRCAFWISYSKTMGINI